MRKTEQKLWDRMRSNMRARHPEIRMERIENLMGAGMPDLVMLASGHIYFAELKAIEFGPVFATTPALGSARGLSVAQRNGHLEWNRDAVTSLIIVGIGSSETYFMSGRRADAVNQMTITQMKTATLARDWFELGNWLKGTT
jgi:hypothetical protein